MNAKLKQQKLKMWKDNLAQLEEKLKILAAQKGAVVEEGSLSEDAAYTMANEDAETTRIRIEEIKKIIRDLEKEE